MNSSTKLPLDDLQIQVPYPWKYDDGRWIREDGNAWTIKDAYLKLILKYGISGPWKGWINRSREFDDYTRSRGPRRGLPNVVDLLVTRLMTSSVSMADLSTVENWLSESANVDLLRRAADALKEHEGLEDLSPSEITLVARLADAITTLPDIKGAKTFKWLSAWAPAHIPMIDSYVAKALGDMFPDPGSSHVAKMLDFQRLVKDNLAVLRNLGAHLAPELGFEGSVISPVRVMEILVWFDWYLVRQFESYFEYVEYGTHHELLQPGLDLMKQFSDDRMGVCDKVANKVKDDL